MFDDYNICPYTGLRSFTEDESIYFKGRDEHIQEATKQLERNKFLMVTGASGDGKSSIVYAGIIPNARAGFLKARFSHWQIADFRPERSPFQNFCGCIAEAFGIENTGTVESELQHGFSALIDLYKSSKLYFNKDSQQYLNASDDDKLKQERTASNLLILVDQFEEFFTNQENYVNGVPSETATLTMNILLETAKLARENNIPIYIVFTMRSDFIGQCAAFRELPEYIGFSQFFVPRLNRKLFQEVIEEPCDLSGNKITRRLTERIIHDMGDGVDQLPILQHALNQIWKAADNGKEEMDLIHYAMVGGLKPADLEDHDQEKFNQWFSDLPENIKDCYGDRGLLNVLDTHANKLYQNSTAYVKEKLGKDVSEDLIHNIIKTVFTSLTKIDQSREVRNRMTLEEIRDILNDDNASLEIITAVIDQFREPGNTFVRPFIKEDGDNVLTTTTVLDITHESLIRNWRKLKEWTNEEFDKFVVFKDFKQQVDRWIEHNQSIGFLLPIGSLTFFESWYSESKINKSWVNRYNEQVTDTPKDLEESARIVKDSNSFLLQSARKHLVTRAIIKFGPKRISMIMGLILLLGLSSFYYYDYKTQTNEYVFNKVIDDSFDLINQNKAPVHLKADNLVYRERIEPGSLLRELREIEDQNIKFKIAIGVNDNLLRNDRKGTIKIKKAVLLESATIAKSLYEAEVSRKDVSEGIFDLLNLLEGYEYYNYFYDDEEIKTALQSTGQLLKKLVFQAIDNPHTDLEIIRLNEAIEMCLNNRLFTNDEIEELIKIYNSEDLKISPFYSQDKILVMGRSSETLTHNGKYLILADLNAAIGNVESSIQAIDTLLKYEPRHSSYTTDGSSVAGYFVLYGHWNELDQYCKLYGDRIGYKRFEIYRQIANRSGILTQSISDRFSYGVFETGNLWYNIILDFMSDESLSKLYEAYLTSIEEGVLSSNEKNFNRAIFYKQKGLFYSKRFTDKQIAKELWISDVNKNYSLALDNYRLVDSDYLEEVIPGFFHLPTDFPRRQIFSFPDYIESVPSHAPRTRYSNYLSGTFITHLIDNNILEEMYRNGQELQQVSTWIREYKNSTTPTGIIFEGNELSTEELINIQAAINNHPSSDFINQNMYLLYISNNLFNDGAEIEAIEYAKRIDPQQLRDLYNEEWVVPHIKTLGLIGEVSSKLALKGESDWAFELINAHPFIRNRVRLLDRIAQTAFIEGNREIGNQFLDSAIYYIDNNNEINVQNRIIHSYTLALKGDEKDIPTITDLSRNANGFPKLIADNLNPRAIALNGYYYSIISGIPKYASSEERLRVYNQILYSQVFYSKQAEWQTFDYRHEFAYQLLGYN